EIAEMSRCLIEHGLPPSWGEHRVLRYIADPESVVLVARDRRRLVGFGIMEYHDVDAHLNLLAVRPGYRRRGIAAQLIEWLESTARTAGTFLIRLELRATNDAARRLYIKLGYSEVGRRPGYYSGQEDALCMARDLSAAGISRNESFQRKQH
ncbi:MAG TPA: GNAT family N-acetyltransferase, partial [Gammaproteobacteria bacterium]|nr:GNAT family N-acetyltransferase [Gammaproteobacteria bacterium]